MRLDEFLARCLAARELSLIEDPHGLRLPFEVWRLCLPDAEFIVGSLKTFELHQTIRGFHEEKDEGE